MSFIARNHPQQVGVRGALSFVDDRETAPEFFDPLNERFEFSVDVAASEDNAKLPRFYTIEDGGLQQSWAGERVWCNPPYSDIRPWIEYAWFECLVDPPELIVMLLPANRTEQKWWQELVEPHLRGRTPGFSVEFLPGRMRFIAPGDTSIKPNARPPFGCCLLIWKAVNKP